MKVVQYILKNTVLKIFNSKVGTFAVVMLVTAWSYNQPLKQYVHEMNYPVSWCLFPFIMCSFSFLSLFWFGIIYINSDVPFMQHINMYQILRTGRKKWAVGQIGGIIIRSFVMTIFTVGCTILPLVPHVEISNEWGKLLRTAVMTDAGQLYSFKYYPYYDIFSEFTPIQLMVICVLLCTLICAFIGILMFLISLWANKVFSVAGAGALVLLMFFVVNMHPKIRYKLALFVPTAWMNVAKMATTEMGYYWLPSIRYMFTFLLTGILLMSVVIVWKVRSIEFNWENEDV